jgi:segregation and condensation protein B
MSDFEPLPVIDEPVRAAAQAASASIAAQVESILYATGEPAALSAIAAALDANVQDVESALAELSRGYAGRGVRLQRQANHVQLVTAPEFAERVQRFLGLEAANRLSAAAVETLAIIAYKQPITKPQIEMIRGVNCDGVMKTLELHNLIQELGRVETVGRPMRYGVSFEFWQHFGLGGIHDLPPIEHIDTLPAPEADTDAAPSLSTPSAEAPPVEAPPVEAMPTVTRTDSDESAMPQPVAGEPAAPSAAA